MAYSRRQFLSNTPVAVAGSLLLSQSVLANTKPVRKISSSSLSGLSTGETLPLTHTEIPSFLSAEQLQVHHDKHYAGALKGYLNLDAELIGEKFDSTGYAGRLRTRSQKANSALLHELYFSGMAPQSTAPDEQLLSAIQNRFGSLERWWEDFQAASASSRGWALLVYQPLSGKLYNIISDNHANGVLWGTTPIIALDMFEHAYYLDYQNNKTEYIKRFINHIDGQQISLCYQKALQM